MSEDYILLLIGAWRDCHLYYCLDNPEISDETYDENYRRLQQLEINGIHPLSPTQHVGCPLCKGVEENADG